MFKGLTTAIVTPFKNGAIDYQNLKRWLTFQKDQNVDGILAFGTTAEVATLTDLEYETALHWMIEQLDKQLFLLIGTGTNSTAKTLARTRLAKKAGADGVLIVNPYYNRPSQQGLIQHFETLANVDIPICLYNIPSRTAVHLAVETVVHLAKHPNIVAIKESSGSLEHISEVLTRTQDQEFTVLSGDDLWTLPLMALGAQGAVSVLSNLLPGPMKQFVQDCQAMAYDKARAFHREHSALIQALFLETNPVPVKTALALMGWIQPDVRLPLCSMQAEHQQVLEQQLRLRGLLSEHSSG